MSEILATAIPPERAIILHPFLKMDKQEREMEEILEEATGLAHAINLDVVLCEAVALQNIRPASYIGKGKAEEIAGYAKAENVQIVIMDISMSPIQQRNLEQLVGCKVIDRTALILEIFGERAQTKEGRLQVELAALDYQKSRLVRSWTHLERQRGGAGFMGGPGETQIESDRRIIRERIVALKGQLKKVVRTRELHRKGRRDTPYPIVALVGYTNAGKSTLFNRLTGANVMAEDTLFATLDPTMRALTLPSGRTIIVSDTVGFVSNLPTELVAAFRATLEEVIEADIVLHVRDIASPSTEVQKHDVERVLHILNMQEKLANQTIEVFNKIDKLDTEDYQSGKDIIPISAYNGEGCDVLLAKIDQMLSEDSQALEITLPVEEGKMLAFLYEKGQVLTREDTEEIIHITAIVPSQYQHRLKAYCKEIASRPDPEW